MRGEEDMIENLSLVVAVLFGAYCLYHGLDLYLRGEPSANKKAEK